ncbi:unnamed protein product [Notodromas monacha]|uniref:Ubiquitin carboxyl-terminal hydrolase n=1 Tax=Notodromas monacha TaxID=399045 RepID=A0A7R9G9B3_9CRUS|nr:unnamed protein product [Notodromas monacha]CAG0913012.1 unnamed protein product [Notodromas monacha]
MSQQPDTNPKYAAVPDQHQHQHYHHHQRIGTNNNNNNVVGSNESPPSEHSPRSSGSPSASPELPPYDSRRKSSEMSSSTLDVWESVERVQASAMPGLAGLRNACNDCYINSPMQCLSATLPFVRYFLSGHHVRDQNPTMRQKRGPNMAHAVSIEHHSHGEKILAETTDAAKIRIEQASNNLLNKDLIDGGGNKKLAPGTIWEPIPRKDLLSCSELKKVLGVLNPVYRDDAQEDAYEFLQFLIQTLHEELDRNPPEQRVLQVSERDADDHQHHSHGEKILAETTDAAKIRIEQASNNLLNKDLIDGGGNKKLAPGVLGMLLAIELNQLFSCHLKRIVQRLDLTSSVVRPPSADLRPTPRNSQVPISSPSEYWSEFYKRTNSVVTDLFYGLIVLQDTCSVCKRVHKKFEPMNSLYLPIVVQEDPVTLEACVSAFFAREEIRNFHCQSCDSRSTAIRNTTLYRSPDILVLRVNRDFNRLSAGKVDTPIDVESDVVDLSRFASPEAEKQCFSYELYAVCNHYGSIQTGHYTAHVKLQTQNGTWYRLDDDKIYEKIAKAPDKMAIEPYEVYILFFQRLDGPLTEEQRKIAKARWSTAPLVTPSPT